MKTDQHYIDDLIVRFLANETLAEENQSLANWMNESVANREYFESFRNIWLSSSQMPSSKRVIKQPSFIEFNKESRTQKQIFFFSFGKVAAIFVVAFLTGAFGYHFFTGNSSTTDQAKPVTIESRRGAMSVMVLPDGTRVWLNSGSRITYDNQYNNRLREVHLAGEAYFDVITNPSKPFVVKAGKISIKAMGTSFNVKAYPEDYSVITTLVKGKVIIEGKDSQNKDFSINLKPKQTITFFTDKKEFTATRTKTDVTLHNDHDTSQIVMEDLLMVKREEPKTELCTSWRDENWVIEKQSLGNLARQLERRYNVTIEMNSECVKRFRFTGTIQNETIEQIMEIIVNTMPLKYSASKGKIYLWEDHRRIQEFKR